MSHSPEAPHLAGTATPDYATTSAEPRERQQHPWSGGRATPRGELGRVCPILVGGMPEPDLDRGDVDRALEDELALIGAHRDCPEVLELVDRPFDGVALLVGLAVEHWWPSTGRALGEAGLLLIGLLRDRRLDPASPQVNAALAAGVSLVGQQPIGSGPRSTRAGPGDLEQ